MIQLTEDQRAHLQLVVNGQRTGSYFAANVVLQLASGSDREFVAKTCFCTLDDVEAISELFDRGGVEAIASFRG